MSNNNNRDNFSEDTKRHACDRVGSMCSICGCLTKAASAEDSCRVLNKGVAAHICAAAPNGPRYDPNMTSDERKSIGNCIWLCQTHGWEVDHDDLSLYTKEHLLELKSKAEERARNAWRSGKNSFTIIENSGFNIQTTHNILADAVCEGEYVKLKILLDELSESIMNNDMQDLYEYYSIVYSFYCDRESLKKKLDEYTSKSSANHIDNLVELFTIFMSKEYLQIIANNCTNTEFSRLSRLVLDDQLDRLFVRLSDDRDKTQERVQNDSILHKLVTNYAIENKIPLIYNLDGTECHLYEGEFYFKQKVLLHRLGQKVFNLYLVKEQHISFYDEYIQFSRGLEKFKCLAPELQLWFWTQILSAADIVSDQEIFELALLECNEKLRNEFPLKRIVLFHSIDFNINNVKFDELRKFCEAHGDYSLLHAYFNGLLRVNPKLADKLFNDHKYLLEQDSLFLEDYIQVKTAKGKSNFSVVNFLLEYNSNYSEDIAYNILLAFYSSKNKKNKNLLLKSSRWLKDNLEEFTKIPLPVFDKYLHVLREINDFETLFEIGKIVMPVNLKMVIAKLLCQSKEYRVKAVELLVSIKKEYGKVPYLNQLMFECYYHLGDISSAKKSLIEEVETKATKENIVSLLSLKLETKDVAIDKYIEIAKGIVDAKVYYLIGITYNECNKSEEAYRYLLKSLLLDDKDLNCLNAIMGLTLKRKSDAPTRVDEGVTVWLRSDDKKVALSIHDESIIEKITPNRFMGMFHYSENDGAVEDIMYRSIGDSVEFRSHQYKIVSIEWTSSVICSNAMNALVSSKRAIAFKGKSAEEIKRQLVKVLKERQEHISYTISVYNEHKGLVPLTFLADSLSKKILEAYAFLLFENKEKLLTGYNVYKYSSEFTYVLSLESIYILSLLEIDEATILKNKCVITLTTKRIMLSEINALIDGLKNGSSIGQICLKDDTVYRVDDPEKEKYARIKFWNRVKRLLNAIPCCSEQYFYDYENELSTFFADNKLHLEGDLIGSVKHNANHILVCDSVFTSQIAILHNLPVTNVINYLIGLGLNVDHYLQCIQKLAQLNFANYIPSQAYEYLKFLIYTEKDKEKQVHYVEQFCAFLAGRFLEEGSEAWKYHNKVVQSIISSCKIDYEKSDSLDKQLIRIISYNYSKEHPEEFRKFVEDFVAGYFDVDVDENVVAPLPSDEDDES